MSVAAEGKPGSLARRFWRLAFYNILANLTVPLVGLVDTGMLGHLDDIRFLGGVALGAIVFDYVYWTFGFLRMGTTGTTAQALGRGDHEAVYVVLYRGAAVAALAAAAILLGQRLLADAGFALLSGSPGVEAAGRDYFFARVWGAPATLINFALLGWFLGREESGRALVMTVVANVANIALNWVFIIELGLAARGAGLATMLSQYLMLATGLVLFARAGRPVRWRWQEVLDRDGLGAFLALNRDILVRTVCLISAFAAFLDLSAVVGTVFLAASTILHRLLNTAAWLIDGLAFAVESLAGILSGADDRDGLRRLVRLALAAGLAFAAVFLLPVVIAPAFVARVFTDHREVVAAVAAHAWWLAPTLVAGSVAYVLDGLFLGLTAGPLLRNAMLASLLLGFVPLAAAAAVSGSGHLLWLALAAFMVARALTLGIPAYRRLAG